MSISQVTYLPDDPLEGDILRYTPHCLSIVLYQGWVAGLVEIVALVELAIVEGRGKSERRVAYKSAVQEDEAHKYTEVLERQRVTASSGDHGSWRTRAVAP